MTRPAGIYRLMAGDFFYFGSSANLVQRKRDHQWRLRNGIHPCKRIQDAFNTTGEAAFTPTRFLKKSPDESDSDFRDRLRYEEQKHLDEHAEDPNLENKSLDARSSGMIAEIAGNLWQDPETRKIMIERSRRNASNPSPETREKMAHAKRGVNNVKSRSVIVTNPDGSTTTFPSVTEAAAFFKTSQQLFDTWLKKTAPWPGSGKRVLSKNRWIADYSAEYAE